MGEVLTLERPLKTRKKEPLVLAFLEEDESRISMPHDDVLIVTMIVANHAIRRILVDSS